MGSYNFGNTKHGFDDFPNGNPPFNSSSARHRYAENPFYDSTEDAYTNISMPNSASYDGEGVDIIIMDTGVDATHPEFFDTDGNSRVEQIDWYSHMSSSIQQFYQPSISDLSNFTGHRSGQAIDYYTSTDRIHGTMTASASAGIKHGYAKGARIFDCPTALSGPALERYTDGAITKHVLPSIRDATDAIVNWKNSRTGSDANRPVIVNMSFGGIKNMLLTDLQSITYRGTTTNRSGTGHSKFGTWQIQDLIDAGFHNAAIQLPRYFTTLNSWVYAIQTEFESSITFPPYIDRFINSLTNAGIHVTKSAGNSQRYRVPPGHADYDNYITMGGRKFYWCRGDHNRTGAIICGASKARTHQSSLFPVYSDAPSWTHPSNGEDKRSAYSGFGPGIDLYAVADANWQAWPVNHKIPNPDNSQVYRSYKTYNGTTDTNHQEYYYYTGGTSTAAPVIAGLLATYLERYPTKTPAQAKADMKSMGLSSKMHTISDSTVLSNSSDFSGWWNHTDGSLNNPYGPDNDGTFEIGDSTNSLRYAHVGDDTPLIAHNTDLAITTSVAPEPPVNDPPPRDPDEPTDPPPEEPTPSDAALRNLTLRNVIIT